MPAALALLRDHLSHIPFFGWAQPQSAQAESVDMVNGFRVIYAPPGRDDLERVDPELEDLLRNSTVISPHPGI